MRGRRTVAPPPGSAPKLAWASPRRAEAWATMKSHIIASSSPPPAVTPFTAAITGLGMAFSTSSMAEPRSRKVGAPVGGAEASGSAPVRSAPAQKARPLPESTITRVSVLSRSAVSASRSSRMQAMEMAFRAWGRFR